MDLREKIIKEFKDNNEKFKLRNNKGFAYSYCGNNVDLFYKNDVICKEICLKLLTKDGNKKVYFFNPIDSIGIIKENNKNYFLKKSNYANNTQILISCFKSSIYLYKNELIKKDNILLTTKFFYNELKKMNISD